MPWKEMALNGDIVVPSISVAAPQPVDMDPATPGVTGDYADAGHIHGLGPLEDSADASQQSVTSLVLEHGTVGAEPDHGVEVKGEVYWDTGTKHPYVYVP